MSQLQRALDALRGARTAIGRIDIDELDMYVGRFERALGQTHAQPHSDGKPDGSIDESTWRLLAPRLRRLKEISRLVQESK